MYISAVFVSQRFTVSTFRLQLGLRGAACSPALARREILPHLNERHDNP